MYDFKIQTARHRFKRFDSLTRITEVQDGGAVYWRITEKPRLARCPLIGRRDSPYLAL